MAQPIIDSTECLPVPTFHGPEDAAQYLAEELPEWLLLLAEDAESGRPIDPRWLCDLATIARAAATYARTGEAPAVADHAREHLAELAQRIRQESEAAGDSAPDRVALLTRSLERIAHGTRPAAVARGA